MVILISLQTVFLAFQIKTSILRTRLSLIGSVVSLISTFAAAYTSFMEDQRSVAPSDILVLFFSVTSLLNLPRLRSYWLISESSMISCRNLWTTICVVTIAIALAESITKTKLYRQQYKTTTKEISSGFWLRSLFIWLLPFLRVGFSKVLQLQDIPDVDVDLQGQTAKERLQVAWERTKGEYWLLKSIARAYLWPFLYAVIPRLALIAFKFAQPFLITATINYVEVPSDSTSSHYGPALVGAFVLVYVGIAVSDFTWAL